MNIRATSWNRNHRSTRHRTCALSMAGFAIVILALLYCAALADAAAGQDGPQERYISVLCVTRGTKLAGTITHIMVLFTVRDDSGGLEVHFNDGPGRLTQETQAATTHAIAHTARALGVSTDSWSVGLSVVDPGVIIEGDSLTAMVGLTVVAMAKGESIPRSRIITGTVTRDGRIGPVGGVALKVRAARQAGLQMVLVPSIMGKRERIPGLTQVFPVGSVSQAYHALTASPSRLGNS